MQFRGLQHLKDINSLTHVGYVSSGEQDLGNWLPQLPKQIIPQSDKTALADGSKSLAISNSKSGTADLKK